MFQNLYKDSTKSGATATAAARARILVVDDHESGRYALVHCLLQAGYEVYEASTAEEAFNRIAKGQAELVLLDVNLPAGSGIEICRKLKQDPKTAEIPVIQMSALFTAAGDRITGLESGANVYPTALFEPRELLAYVEALLRAKRAEEKLRASHDTFHDLVQNSPFGIYVVDSDFRLVQVSAGARKVFENVRPLLGRDFSEVLRAIWQEPFATEAISRFRHTLETGETFQSPSTVERRRDIAEVESYDWKTERLTLPNGRFGVVCYFYDLSERQRYEAALRESEEQFRAMFNVASVGKTQTDAKTGRFLRVNAAFCDLTGYTEAELLERTPLDVTHPDDRERDAAILARIARNEASGYDMEKRYLRPDGRVVWVHVSANVIRDAAGRPFRTAGVIHNITQQKEAEKALRQTQERLHQALAAGKVMSFHWDLTSDAIQRSPNSTQIMGEGATVGTGADFFANIHPDDREALTDLQGSLAPEQPCYSTSYRYIRPSDGQEIVFEDTGCAEFDAAGHLIRVQGLVRDLTERKRDQDALLESEKRLRLAKAAGGIGIHDFDLTTGELLWDNRLRELWGLSPDEAVSYDIFISGVHPEDRAAVDTALQRTQDPAGDGRFYIEHRLLRHGMTRWIAATGQATFEKGKAVRLVGTAQDITERKQFQAELERLVVERTAKLHDMVAELEHFSYSITHDMRAPLRAMRGFAEIIKETLADAAQPEIQTSIRQIIISAERMDLLIADALNYSKTVRQDLPLTRVDMGKLIEGMLDTYPRFLANRSCIRIEENLPFVIGNEAGLTQCFSNLISNALKFVVPNKAPEVRIWAEPLDPPATEHAGDAKWVRIWVEDKGIGISERMLPRIFNMFARGSVSQGGTGIGLALVRKVVQRMGGKVGVESKQGEGSRFWVEIPSADMLPQTQPGPK